MARKKRKSNDGKKRLNRISNNAKRRRRGRDANRRRGAAGDGASLLVLGVLGSGAKLIREVCVIALLAGLITGNFYPLTALLFASLPIFPAFARAIDRSF